MSIRIPPQADVDLRNSLTDVQSEIDTLTADLAKLRGETGSDADIRRELDALKVEADIRFTKRETYTCRLTRSATQSTTSGALTPIDFTVELHDMGDLHESVTNPSRITLPVGGLWLVGGHFAFATSGAGTYRLAYLELNATTYVALQFVPPNANQPAMLIVTTLRRYSAGDYLKLIAHQDSGGPLNVHYDGVHEWTPIFWALRVGD